MAMKKRTVPKKEPERKKNDETVVYKAIAILAVTCVVLLALQMVSRYYTITNHFLAVYNGLAWGAGVFALLFAVGLLGCFLRKKAAFWRVAALPMCLLGLLLSLSCLLLHNTLVEYVPLLYFVYISIAVLYLIELLYQPEFFLLSLVNVCAGGIFYRLSRVYAGRMSTAALLLSVVLVLVIAGSALLLFLADKREGKLKLLGKERRILTHGATPLPLYIICAIWLVCLLATFAVGPVLPYYCVFAAVAFELIAAVYYTMRLS